MTWEDYVYGQGEKETLQEVVGYSLNNNKLKIIIWKINKSL